MRINLRTRSDNLLGLATGRLVPYAALAQQLLNDIVRLSAVRRCTVLFHFIIFKFVEFYNFNLI